eukprot:gene13126-biopygen9508
MIAKDGPCFRTDSPHLLDFIKSSSLWRPSGVPLAFTRSAVVPLASRWRPRVPLAPRWRPAGVVPLGSRWRPRVPLASRWRQRTQIDWKYKKLALDI